MAHVRRTALPVGRTARAVLGVVAAVEGGRHLLDGPATLVGWTAGVFVGELLISVAMLVAIARITPAANRWSCAVLALVPIAAIYAVGGTAGELGTLLFLGVSLVVTAVRGDASCELMALPGLLLGRQSDLPCLLLCPVDWLEASVRNR